MKVLWLAGIVVISAMTGCMIFNRGISGSGVAETQRRDIGTVDSISVSGAGKLTLTVRKPPLLNVTVDDNLQKYVQTSVSSGRLTIRPTANIRPKVALTIEGNISPINSFTSAGSADVELNGLEGDKLELTITGSGSVTVNGGMVQTLSVTVTGSGSADISGLHAETARVRITGSGGAKVYVEDSVDVSVTGSGHVDVDGDPETRNPRVVGSGSVNFVSGSPGAEQ